MNYTPHAGQIGYQLGACINDIRDCVRRQDLAGVKNHVRLMYMVCHPKLSKDERAAYHTLPVDDDDEDDWSIIFEWQMQRGQFLLDAMAERNIYAWTESPIQDAGELALDGV